MCLVLIIRLPLLLYLLILLLDLCALCTLLVLLSLLFTSSTNHSLLSLLYRILEDSLVFLVLDSRSLSLLGGFLLFLLAFELVVDALFAIQRGQQFASLDHCCV